MTADTITETLEAEERAALDDPRLRALAKAALVLAERVAPGTFSPDPALPSDIYSAQIARAGRIARLRYVTERGERPGGAVGGYFTADQIIEDVTLVMRSAVSR